MSCVNFDNIYDDTVSDVMEIDKNDTLSDVGNNDTVSDVGNTTLGYGVMETDKIAYPSTTFPTVLSSTEARRKVTDVVTRKPADEARKRGQVGRAARRKGIKMGDSGKFQIFLSTTFQNYFTLNR